MAEVVGIVVGDRLCVDIEWLDGIDGGCWWICITMDFDGGFVLFLEMAEGGKGRRPMKPVPP